MLRNKYELNGIKLFLNQVLRSKCAKALLLLLIVSGATLGVSSKEAHAFTIYSQPDSSELFNSPLGESRPGQFATSTVFNVPTDIGTTTLTARFSLGSEQNPFSSACAGNWNNRSVNLVKVGGGSFSGQYNFDAPDGTDICTAGEADTAHYFEKQISVTNMTAGDYYFTLGDDPGSNFSFLFFTNAEGEMYFELADGSFSPPESEISITSPTEQTYIGNPITFAGSYTNADTYDQIQFDLVSTSYSLNVNFPSHPIPLSNVVDEPWSTIRNVPFNGNYDVRVRLFDSTTGSTTPYTDYVSFAVGTTTAASNVINEVLGSTVGTATSTLLSSDNLFSFLNVPELLRTKAPFGYFFLLKDELELAIIGTGASDIPAGTLTWINPSDLTGTSTIDFFSPATIQEYLSPSLIALFRGLEAAVLYIGTLYLLYHRARNKSLL